VCCTRTMSRLLLGFQTPLITIPLELRTCLDTSSGQVISPLRAPFFTKRLSKNLALLQMPQYFYPHKTASLIHLKSANLNHKIVSEEGMQHARQFFIELRIVVQQPVGERITKMLSEAVGYSLITAERNIIWKLT
jgi:hypothetical protein